MANASITVRLEGDDAAGGDLQLGEFIDELSAIRSALRQAERSVLGGEDQSVRYRVTGLSHSSPSTLVITMFPREPAYKEMPKRISRRFGSTLNVVRRNHRYAERLDLRTLESLRAIASPAAKRGISVVVTTEQRRSVRVDKEFNTYVSRLISGDERERDELVGRIESVDIHNKNSFVIYPVVGPDRVRCSAPRKLQAQVVAAIGQYVSVEGLALYRKDAPFPYALRAEAIHPRSPDDDLPTMQSLHGIAPNATSGLSGEEFVRKLRNAYW